MLFGDLIVLNRVLVALQKKQCGADLAVAVSHHLGRIEARLGVALFQRVGRRPLIGPKTKPKGRPASVSAFWRLSFIRRAVWG